jgi:hypothetical protein
MRYVIALMVAAFLIAAGTLYVWMIPWLIKINTRKAIPRLEREGDLPPDLQGIDLNSLELTNSMMEVPRGMMHLLGVAHWLTAYWFRWALLAIIGALSVAALIG